MDTMADTAWLFGNDEYSDARVVLTTETPEECKNRVLGHDDAARKLSALQGNDGVPARTAPASAESSSQGADASHLYEELPGHKLILVTKSEYFRTCFNWDRRASDPADSGKRQRDSPPLAIISVPSADWIPAAKSTVQFMYTQRLAEDMSRMALLQMYQLSDEYRILTLRRACLVRLAEVEVCQFAAEERQLLQLVTATVLHDETSTCPELSQAAATICRSIVQHFVKLEKAWYSQRDRDMFCTLPQQLALRIVQSDQLQIRSENTVLVAALSWLRTAGQAASDDERRQLLQAVRVARLSPWFLSWALFGVEEVQQLLPRVTLGRLVRCALSEEPERSQIVQGDELLQRWGARREGEARFVAKVPIQVAVNMLADMVAECQKTDQVAAHIGPHPRHFNGLVWTPVVCVMPGDGGVRVWAGLTANLEVAGHQLVHGPDMDKVAVHAQVGWGSRLDIVALTLCDPQAAELGARYGQDLVNGVKSADELQSKLRDHIKDEHLDLMFTVLF